MKHGNASSYLRGCRCEACCEAARKRRRRGLPDGDPRHGTTNGYGNYGCRCGPCRLAAREMQLAAVAARKAVGLPEGDPRHGTYNGYANYGCRCSACKDANTQYARDYRARSKATAV